MKRMPGHAIKRTGHHFQWQRGHLLQQRNLRQRQHQCHQQHRQQPPAAVGQPRRPSAPAAVALLPAGSRPPPATGWPATVRRAAQSWSSSRISFFSSAMSCALSCPRSLKCATSGATRPSKTRPMKSALRLHPGPALQQRPVQIASSIALGGNRALGQQAVEQGLDGRLGPVAMGQRGHHVIGTPWCLLPQHLHHNGFGFADRGHGLHP